MKPDGPEHRRVRWRIEELMETQEKVLADMLSGALAQGEGVKLLKQIDSDNEVLSRALVAPWVRSQSSTSRFNSRPPRGGQWW